MVEADGPDWDVLWAFPLSLLFLLLAAFILTRVWQRDATGQAVKQPLKYLDASWSLSGSWVSNVTAIGGLLTLVFGSSEVTTALLGENAKEHIALATAGSAFAAVLVTAGPVVLLAMKNRQGAVTTGGLLTAGAITLSAAYGELFVLASVGGDLALGGWQDTVPYIALAAALLLAVYGYRSLKETHTIGSTPRPQKRSEVLEAAQLIVAALQSSAADPSAMKVTIAEMAAAYPAAEISAAEEPLAARTALL